MPNVRRQYPKVTGSFAVQLTNSDGDTIGAIATEISSNTILLECDKATATRIIPNLGDTMYNQNMKVDTLCTLPLTSGQVLYMKGRGTISGVRRVTQDTYHVCIEQLEIDDDNYSCLSLFIEQRL
jgi:hypothetical protein